MMRYTPPDCAAPTLPHLGNGRLGSSVANASSFQHLTVSIQGSGMTDTATDMTAHGAVSPAPRNVGEGFKKSKHEMTGADRPEGLLPSVTFFLESFGHMMSRLVLTILYALLIAPIGIFYRMLADPFLSKYPSSNSSYTEWKSNNSTLDEARRQG